jgi:hypothetical protein
MIRIEAEATCSQCRAHARCTVDVDALMSRRHSSPGGATHGIPGWYWADASNGNLYGNPNLACSEKCVAVLTKESNFSGVVWKHCPD